MPPLARGSPARYGVAAKRGTPWQSARNNHASEQERVHEDELHSLMRSILDWAISFLSESSQGTIRAIYFEGKTVKQHSEEEYVTVYAIYKRLARSYPVIKEIVLEELEGLDDETRAELEAMFGIGGRDEK